MPEETIKVGLVEVGNPVARELIHRIERHPRLELVALQDREARIHRLGEVFGEFRGRHGLPPIEPVDQAKLAATCDAVFLCLPHGESVDVVPSLVDEGVRVFDLSSDYRFRDRDAYSRAWGKEHPRPDLNRKAVYGLPEIYRGNLMGAQLVSVPGSFPSAVLLALAPLMRHDLIMAGSIIADCKGGLTTAQGLGPEDAHFVSAHAKIQPYFPASPHHHRPEIEEHLARLGGNPQRITFVPHLAPMERGILATCYATLREATDQATLSRFYLDFYGSEPFIRVLDSDAVPRTDFVRGTNFCDIAVRVDAPTQRLIVAAAIDNLGKGSASQAIQCLNLSFKLSESAGLL